MNPARGSKTERELTERLANSGLRFTSQRRHVYDVLIGNPDHPTAEEVFMRAKRGMPEISHATVYNSLEALVHCGLARQVRLERGASRYCPNMKEHCHFFCDSCGRVVDVSLSARGPWTVAPPRGFKIDHYEIAVHGICSACAGKPPKQ